MVRAADNAVIRAVWAKGGFEFEIRVEFVEVCSC